MNYTILFGEYAYSSWSMRGWMMLDAFGIPYRSNYVPMYSDDFTAFQTEYAPARTVATLLIDEGVQDRKRSGTVSPSQKH